MIATYFANLPIILIYTAIGLVMLIAGMLWFDFIMTRGYKLKKQLYEDDNHAAGIVLSSFVISEVFVIMAVMLGEQAETQLLRDIILCFLYFITAMIIFFIFRTLYKLVMKSLLKVDIDVEVFEQNNLAAARVEGAVYIALGLIIAVCVH